MAAKRIKITLVKSLIGRSPKQRRTVEALGLGRISSSVEHDVNPVILGMVAKVAHLVKVEELV